MLILPCTAKIVVGGFMYLGQVVPACEYFLPYYQHRRTCIRFRWVRILRPCHHPITGPQSD